MSLIHREPNIIFIHLEDTVALEASLRRTRRKERITAFGAEEVLFVICTRAKFVVVQRDEDLVNNSRLTVVASRSMNVMVIEMTIWPTPMLIGAKVLE